MKKVFAAIVTYKRPEILRACIKALLSQRTFGLGRIYIVVNSMDAATIEVIKSFDEQTTFLNYDHYDNPGPAGGFYHGLRKFLEEDYEYAWLMDDDVVVRGDCLKQLLLCTKNGEYLCPKVMTENGKELGSYGWWGVLLSKSVVERAGLPLKDLFYWTEDTEYLQHRIRRIHKGVLFRCRAAVVSHLHSRAHKRPSWYYYYVIRNTLFYRIYVLRLTWRPLTRTVYAIPKFMFRILFKEDNKIRKIKLMMYGIYHGVIGKIGKLVDPELNE